MARRLTAKKSVRGSPVPARPAMLFPTTADEGVSTLVVPADQNVFVQGQASDALYYLRSGMAKGHILSKTGQEAVIILLGPGEVCGESSLMTDARRVATVTTLTECAVDRIEPDEVHRRLGRDPAFAKMLLEFLVSRNRRYLIDLSDHHFHSTEKRLARALLRLAKPDGNGKLKVTMPRLSQETLAGMVGTTRPRVNLFLNKFRRQGMIEYSGKSDDEFVVHKSLATILDRK
jgi:CRP-like cAMP-binding protein